MCQIFLRTCLAHPPSLASTVGVVQAAVVRRYPYATSLASQKIKKSLFGLSDQIWRSHLMAMLCGGFAGVILTAGRFETDRED
ncbi:hypothetical protein [Tautonia rosea]|uniref:hypothetical protein n=1 Tax=Tautonia rosea TaxID=2728037 RepID=UPI00147526BA|nr:hypothetical protein [Tautonia rosea]